MAPRARFELATLRLTAEVVKIQSAPFGVAYKKTDSHSFLLAAPKAAPTICPLKDVLHHEPSSPGDCGECFPKPPCHNRAGSDSPRPGDSAYVTGSVTTPALFRFSYNGRIEA